MTPTVAWENGVVVMIDQRRLPAEESLLRCRDHHEVAAAIRDMAIRGAPAIGVAAALGLALGASLTRAEGAALRAEWSDMCAALADTRPTAVNLFWAIERMRRRFEALAGEGGETLRTGAPRRGARDPAGGRPRLPARWATSAPSCCRRTRGS